MTHFIGDRPNIPNAHLIGQKVGNSKFFLKCSKNGTIEVKELGRFKQFLRSFFGVYKSTHLNTVLKRLNNVQGYSDIKIRMQGIWENAHPNSKKPSPLHMLPQHPSSTGFQRPDYRTSPRGDDYLHRRNEQEGSFDSGFGQWEGGWEDMTGTWEQPQAQEGTAGKKEPAPLIDLSWKQAQPQQQPTFIPDLRQRQQAEPQPFVPPPDQPPMQQAEPQTREKGKEKEPQPLPAERAPLEEGIPQADKRVLQAPFNSSEWLKRYPTNWPQGFGPPARLTEIVSEGAERETLTALTSDHLDNDFKPYYQENAQVAEGSRLFDRDYVYFHISGDGHCMFRSVAAGILIALQQADPQTRAQFFERLEGQIQRLEHLHGGESEGHIRNLQESYRKFLEIAQPMQNPNGVNSFVVGSENNQVNQIMWNRKASDDIVQFLRNLACTYNAVYMDQDFLGAALHDTNGIERTPAIYFDDMRRMHATVDGLGLQKGVEMGSHPELAALAEVLDLHIKVLDLQAAGTGQDLNQEHYLHGRREAALGTFLVYGRLHYDVGMPRMPGINE